MDGRLITCDIKKATHSSVGFWPTPNPDAAPEQRPADEAARDLPDGYEAFPAFPRQG